MTTLTHRIVPLACCTVLSSGLAPGALAQGPERLLPSEFVATEDGPAALDVGDLDGDGRAELVVALAADTNLAVLELSDDGMPFPLATYPTGGRAVDVRLALVDGDAHLDALVASDSLSELVLLIGDGAGGFAAPVSFPAGVTPYAMDVGDLDEDGALDVAIAGGPGGAVTLLFGDGTGGFGPAVGLVIGSNVPDVAIADIDQDQNLDLVICRAGGSSVDWRAGDGTGGFAAPQLLNAGPLPTTVDVGDLNGDPYPDVAVSSSPFGGPFPLVFFGGPGGLTPGTGGLQGTAGAWIRDVTGDGNQDLVYGYPSEVASQLRVLEGDGAGGFATEWTDIPCGVQPRDPLSFDLDGDGVLDLITADQSSDTLTVHFGVAAGGLAIVDELWTAPQGNYTNAVAARPVDADADGLMDLALLVTLHQSQGADGLSLALGNGDGTLADPELLHHVGLWVGGLDVGDVNADGIADAVFGRYTGLDEPSTARVSLGDGVGSFGVPTSSPLIDGFVNELALADLDLDGDLDAACVTDSFVGSAGTGVALGDGLGGFAPGFTVHDGDSFTLAVGDVNADGYPDLVSAGYFSGSARVLVNQAGAGFVAEDPVAFGFDVRQVRLADVDLDTDLDLVAVGDEDGNGAEGRLGLSLGDGASGFGCVTTVVTGADTRSVGVADVTGDGLPDYLCGNFGDLAVFPGDGAGGLDDPRRFHAAGQTTEVVPTDLDGDGRLDVVLCLRFGNQLYTYVNARPYDDGVAVLGTGTSGCIGVQGLDTSTTPAVGAFDLELLATSAPENGVGFRLLSSGADALGSDLLGIGILLHADPLASVFQFALDFTADEQGYGRAPLPIPANPSLAGQTVAVQAVWLWTGSCQPTPLGLSSSRGLALTIQP